MFLSKIELNSRSRQVRYEMAHPYQMHRTVMSGFPQFRPEERERVLFRVDNNLRTRQIDLLVQSQEIPNWDHLVGNSDYCASDPLFKRFRPVLFSGQQRYFRVRTNPTFKTNGKRLGLLREEQQQDWLNRKAKEGGFQIDSLTIKAEGMGKDLKRSGESVSELSFLSVVFEGVLQVLNPELFLATLNKGLGTGKSVGFGLFSIAPNSGE